MFISHRYQVIFVHIQRTGGNSIYSLFEQHDPHLHNRLPFAEGFTRFKHPYACDIQQVVDAETFAHYKKFAVVRNPFDRLVSWYAMFQHKTIDKTQIAQEKHPQLWDIGNRVEAAFDEHVQSFDDFIHLPPEGLFARFHVPQCAFVCAEDGRLLVDQILRFETLAADFAAFAHTIGLDASLPRSNASQRDQDYRRYYTPALRDLVTARFQEDLDVFGYAF
jgi:hypothetical protein